MKKPKKSKNLKIIATGLASASLLSGCGPSRPKEPKEVQDWRKAPGTNGFINLGDVVKAFNTHKKAEDFEKRVNEIYEGDHLLIFQANANANATPFELKYKQEPTTEGFVYAAIEDLNQNEIVDAGDDPLFYIEVLNNKATLYGLGVNKYYRYSWTYTPTEEKKEESSYVEHYRSPYYHHWYYGRGWGNYYTPRERYSENKKDRNKYRGSNEYVSQLKSNAKYESTAARAYGRSFTASADNQSDARKNYITNAPKSSNFRSTIGSNPTSKQKSSSGTSSTYSRTAMATGAVVGGLSSRGGRYGGSRGSSGIGI